jgi:hypothetical protein
VAAEPEQVEGVPPSLLNSSLDKGATEASAEASESEASLPQTPTPVQLTDAAQAGETVTNPGIVDATPAEIPALPEQTTPNSAATAPSLGVENGAASCEKTEPLPPKDEPLPKARTFSDPKPPSTRKLSTKNERKTDSTPRADSTTSPIRLQLVFGRGGSVKTLALVPHRREGMPSNVEVRTANGRLRLSEWSADSYQPMSESEFSDALSEGLVWEAREGGTRWRWELTKRELYVLAAGDEFGLHGFVTRRIDQRLWLNTRHLILAKENLRDPILAALADAGCAPPEVTDSIAPGVPTGWILFRSVIPTRPVPMRDERDVLNVLCPAHEIEPQFVGGIRLERNVWLAGFPPRVRLTGKLGYCRNFVAGWQ